MLQNYMHPIIFSPEFSFDDCRHNEASLYAIILVRGRSLLLPSIGLHVDRHYVEKRRTARNGQIVLQMEYNNYLNFVK